MNCSSCSPFTRSVSTEGVFAHNVKAGSLAISSTPPIFYLSPQPPLSFTAEVNAFQKVSTIDHLVLGEVDQDDCELTLHTYLFV